MRIQRGSSRPTVDPAEARTSPGGSRPGSPGLSSAAGAGSSRPKDLAGTIITAPAITMTGLAWTVTKSSIRASYSASEAAKCDISGRKHGDPLFEIWTAPTTEHTTHAHTKTGLAVSTQYDVYIVLRTDEGLAAYFPSCGGYYVLQTADAGDLGGGLIATVI